MWFCPGHNSIKKWSFLTLFISTVLLAGCFGSVTNINNACDLLSGKRSWYKALSKVSNRWNVPKSMILAFIHQESRFVAKAKPPRKKLFGFIPTTRPSTAYGYPQALDSTWRLYKKATNSRFADRDDFGDAVDFVGWYIHESRLKLNLPAIKVSDHYLAYHEGAGGYASGSYRNKKWLLAVAQKVQLQSNRYAGQLLSCESRLNRNRLLFF